MANEKRLIDANALDFDFPVTDDLIETGIEMVRARVATAPTVDAVEVVHGRWVHASNKPGVWIGMKCSLCGARIKYSEFTNGNHKYCHKCGASMRDGDGNG